MLPVISRKALDELHITYDIAIPQDLHNDIVRATGDNPFCHVVALYPPGKGSLAGLQAVTIEGAAMLQTYYSTMRRVA